MPKRSGASSTTTAASKKQKKAPAKAKAPPPAAAANDDDLPLSSWRVVLTGEFVLKPKAVLEDALKQKGVTITTTISGKTTHLLLGNKSGVNEYGKKTGVGSSKHTDALARQLPILSEEEVWKNLGAAGVPEAAAAIVTKKSILEITTKPAKKAPLVQKVLFAFQEAEGAGTDTLVREPVEQYFSKWKYCPEESENPVGLTLVAQGGGVYIEEISSSSMFANEPNLQVGMRIKRIGTTSNIRTVDQAYKLLRDEVYDNRLVRLTLLPTHTRTTFVVSLPKLKKELTEQFDGLNFDNTRSKNALKKALATLVDDEEGKLVKQSGTSYALVVERETRPPITLTAREQKISRRAKIEKKYPEQGRWKGLREVSRMKSKSGRATCKACGQIIAKSEMQVQVADSSLLKMLGNDFDRPYTEEDFGLGRTIAVQKFNVHATCLEAANAQYRDIFQEEWRKIRPRVLESRQEELE